VAADAPCLDVRDLEREWRDAFLITCFGAVQPHRIQVAGRDVVPLPLVGVGGDTATGADPEAFQPGRSGEARRGGRDQGRLPRIVQRRHRSTGPAYVDERHQLIRRENTEVATPVHDDGDAELVFGKQHTDATATKVDRRLGHAPTVVGVSRCPGIFGACPAAVAAPPSRCPSARRP